MSEGVASLLRIRVVNRSPLMYFADGFENQAGITTTWWRSLGTEAGTDNSINYWTQQSGVWTYASHLVSAPATANATITAGPPSNDLTDGTWRVRFKWTTGAAPAAIIHWTDANNWIAALHNGVTNVTQLSKMVGGVFTIVSSSSRTLVNNTNYWLECVASGTTYTANLYSDSAGSISTILEGRGGTISDAALQSGRVGLIARAAVATDWGGAFTNVCTFTGTGPDGTQGQAWAPVVTTGEPFFAWSTVSPQAGTYTASIYNANAAGNGAWQQTIRLLSGSSVTLSAQIKQSGGINGAANISAGGIATSDIPSNIYASHTVTGAMTANPTVSCNYSGAIGTAYFDSLAILNAAHEITTNLPHLHTSSYTVQAMQPSSPSSTTQGSFTINLLPPGSEGYAAAKAIYDQLDYLQRVEFYESHDGASLGKLVFGGIITRIDRSYGNNSQFTLTGVSDLWLANFSRPFPGELLSLGYGSGSAVNASYRQARNYFGTNEPGWMDAFNPYTSAGYTSVGGTAFGGTAGTWSGTTDAGFNVVSCSTGTDAALIAKSGAMAGDMLNTQFAEVTGRLLPSQNASNAGKMGIGLTTTQAAAQNDRVMVEARALWSSVPNRWNLTVVIYAGAGSITFTSALTNVDDPEGYIPLTLSIQTRGTAATGDAQEVLAVVNGQVFRSGIIFDLGTANVYPFVYFGTPNSGAATAYMTNLVQEIRYTDDRHVGSAAFKSGTIGTPAHSLTKSSDAAPTFLEVWTRAATIESWYWRYTPQPYVVGTRTLGTIDLTTDPGTDRGTIREVVFSRTSGNLVDLQLSANAEQFASGTGASSVSGTDGGGVSYWRDVSTITKYGAFDDQTLAVATPTFSEQRLATSQIVANKIALSSAGSKSALVLRDPQTADVWRELDKVMIHDPEMGINYLVARVLAYTFDEGHGTQSLILDQFGADFISPPGGGRSAANQSPPVFPPLKRLQQAVFQIANKFGNRS